MNVVLRKAVATVVMLLMLAAGPGCASGPTRVNCDGRLEPVNPPAPKSSPRRAPLTDTEKGAPAGGAASQP